LQSLLVAASRFGDKNEEKETRPFPEWEEDEQNHHHLGSKDAVRLSKLDLYLSLKAHDRHLRRLKRLYDDDDVDTNFGRHFFAALPKSRVKRGGKQSHFQGQNDPGYVALPLPSLPDDVLDNLSEAQLLSRPNKGIIRLANELSEQRTVLPPVVNPIPPKTGPPPADAFEKAPKFPSSIQVPML
jgi:hypothetical protein